MQIMKGKLLLFLLLFFTGAGAISAQTAQTRVQGVVVEESGEPVIGATIQVKGTSRGTVTDIDGRFDMSAPADGVLIVSYVGLVTREVPVGENLRVILETDAELL